MKNLRERISEFLKEDRTRKNFAFLFFIWGVISLTDLFNIILMPIKATWFYVNISGIGFYSYEWVDKNFARLEAVRTNFKQVIKRKAKKIGKEILAFIPLEFLEGVIAYRIMDGEPQNQIGVEAHFWQNPISVAFLSIFIAPLIEEVIFRFLPRHFIKNGVLYVLFSTITFAAMHVIEDPQWYYYIWFYSVSSLWYSYRYYKTNDICIPMALHSFNNIVAIALILFE